MKNIHILSTNSPIGTLGIGLKLGINNNLFLNGQHQHIYITNDEEIKEGCYVISTFDKWRGDGRLKPQIGKILEIHDDYYLIDSFNGDTDNRWEKGHSKKIILTTDLDLIKDGIQPIDDDFLEWFVQNPTCEFVEVITVESDACECYYTKFCKSTCLDYKTHCDDGGSVKEYYKIIIPKEEAKQRFLLFDKEKADAITNEGRKIVRELQNTIQQETLEEYIKEVTKDFRDEMSIKFTSGGIKLGAKWQAEQNKNKYSEEEVILLLHKRDSHINNYEKLHGGFQTPKEWFEQFKKK